MRKTLLFSTMLLAATSVWAFGGIFGGGHKSHNYNGVNSIGVHIDANGDNTTPDITLANCDAYAGTGLVDNETYNGGYAGLASDNQTQCRCETGSKWSDGACVPSDGASCSSWTTNECGSGYYCQFSPESCEEDPTEGVCQVVSSCGATGTYGDFWMSGQTNSVCSLDWWTAQSLCISQGMQLVSLQDLGCAGHEDDNCWSQTLTDIRETDFSYDFWTMNLNEGDNPHCTAWHIYADETYVGADDRDGNNDGGAVLCIK